MVQAREKLQQPYSGAAAVTPSNTVDLPTIAKGFIIGSVAGGTALKADMQGGETVTFLILQTGVVYPFIVKRIYATGTTVSEITALY